MDAFPTQCPACPSCPSRGKTLLVIALVALVVLAGALEMKRRITEKQLEQLTVRLEQLQTGNAQNKVEAQRIVAKVKKLMKINEEVMPTVATIVDVEMLRKRNPFYNKAQNGDFLIVTPERAILYSERTNMILDVVPVQIKPAQPPVATPPVQPPATDQPPQQP
ncbi:MAG: hypothetical protein V1926_04375 [Candidatus Peregrinibacteria bacterium]